jgi:hypothetical protein
MLMVSVKSINHPFIIINNKLLGLVIIHAGEENYDVRYNVKSPSMLDMTKMKTYHVDVAGYSHWAVSIPYIDKEVDPHSLYAFSDLSIQKEFTQEDFPDGFQNFNSLAIITGIPE